MPVVIPLAIDLSLIVALIVALGVLYLYRGTLKPILLGFAALFNWVSIPTPFGHKHPLGFIASWLQSAADAIDHGIGLAVQASSDGVAFFWHQLAKQAGYIGKVLGDLAETVEHRFNHLLFLFPPAAALWLAVRTAQKLEAVPGEVRHLWHAATVTLPRRVGALERTSAEEWARLRRGIDSVRHHLGQRIATGEAALEGSIGLVIRQGEAQAVRLRRIEKELAATAFAGLVLAAIGRLGLSWIRCPSLARINKKHGCVPWRMLEDALGGTFAVLVATDLCRWTALTTTAAQEIRPLLMAFVNAENALVGCHGATKPPPLDFEGYSPTPVIGTLTI